MVGRRPIRLSGYDYGSNGAYLVTVCTRKRTCLFGNVVQMRVELSPIGRLVVESCRSIPSHHPGWEPDAHVIMPDHVHAILIADDRAGQVRRTERAGQVRRTERAGQVRPLQEVVGAFKAQASRRAGRTLWQRGYHDRVIRDEQELTALREYVATNPLRWSLRHEGRTGSVPTNDVRYEGRTGLAAANDVRYEGRTGPVPTNDVRNEGRTGPAAANDFGHGVPRV